MANGNPIARCAPVCPLGWEAAADIARLEAACFPQPWSREQIEAGLAGGALRAAGILQAGELAGYLSYYVVDREAEIVNLAVWPELRRQGLGRAILAFVLRKWHEEGITTAFLEVRAGNQAARTLYASAGFAPAGVRRNYYPDNGEDALIMRLVLHPELPNS